MTEHEWLSCDEPERMLNCTRTLHAAGGFVRPPLFHLSTSRKLAWVERVCSEAGIPTYWARYNRTAKPHELRTALDQLSNEDWWPDNLRRCPLTRRADLLREIVGNPFRPIVLDPSWQTGTVRDMVQRILTTGDFNAMPILADALLDAGCEEETVLRHLRGEVQQSGVWHRCRGCGQIYRPTHKYSGCDQECEGAGYDEVTHWSKATMGHVPECWVLDLLRGGT